MQIKALTSIIEKVVSMKNKTTKMGHTTITGIGYVIDHRKAVRRLILLYVSFVWLWMLQISVRMYVTTGSLDSQYTNLCIAVTTMVGACYAFYFTGRSREDGVSETN